MKDRIPSLKASNRTRLGTRYAKRDRAAGNLPAVIYGHKADPVAVTINSREAVSHFKAGEKVFKIAFAESGGDQMVLLKELQYDYLGDTIVHADFARVDINERVKTKVHINLTGEAKGLKSAGAILMHPTSEIEIECRVADLPESINVDISELELDQSITADKVKLPVADMKLITDAHAIVAQIVEQKEEVVAEAAVVGTEATTPEVIGEKERLEKAAAAEGGDKKGGAAAKPGAAPAKAGAAPAKDAKAPAAKK
ncbi:MAG: 50S ribosomal protein L25 [Phycisphaerales bacterium]